MTSSMASRRLSGEVVEPVVAGFTVLYPGMGLKQVPYAAAGRSVHMPQWLMGTQLERWLLVAGALWRRASNRVRHRYR